MSSFNPIRIGKTPENTEEQVFSAMHALIARLAASVAKPEPGRHADAYASGLRAKHTPAPVVWRNGIIPVTGEIIP